MILGIVALTDTELEKALRQFKIKRSEFAVTDPVALKVLQDKVRKNFRSAAQRLHPDKTNNDPEKTELFRIVCEFAKEVSELYIPDSIRIRLKWSA